MKQDAFTSHNGSNLNLSSASARPESRLNTQAAGEQIQKTAENVKDAAKDVAKDVAKDASVAGKNFSNQLNDKMTQVGDKVSDKVNQVSEKINDAFADMDLKKVRDQAVDGLKDYTKRAGTFVKDRPYASIGVAALAGFGIAMILKNRD